MKNDTIPYIVIAAGLLVAVIAGFNFPGYTSVALGILSGGLTTLGVTMAQANAYAEGRDDGNEEDEL